VDVLRAYRRWLGRRLALLGPSFAAAVLVNLRLALDQRAPLWLKVASMSLALLIVSLLGFLGVETILCARLHRRGGGDGARVLRRQLVSTRGMALASLVLLAGIALLPEIFPDPAPHTLPPAQRQDWVSALPIPAGPVEQPPAEPASIPPPITWPEVSPDPVPAGEPRELPILAGLPLRLELTEREFALPGPAQDPAGEEQRQPVFRPEPDLLLSRRAPAGLPGIDRPGLADERDPGWVPPPEIRIDGLLLTSEGFGKIGAGLLLADVPLTANASLRAGFLYAGSLDYDGAADGEATFQWNRLTLEYVHRLAGYLRRAPFDLALSLGFSMDRIEGAATEDSIQKEARLSPLVGIDVAFWEGGPFGLVLHAGQSFPVNFTGATSAVTDLSALVRWDLTARVSFHAGYRLLRVHLRGYAESLAHEGSRDELDATFSGPLAGVDLRF